MALGSIIPEEARDSFGDDPYEIKNILKHWVFAEKQEFHVIPTDTINIHIDKDAVLRSGMMLPKAIRHLKGEELKNAIPDKLSISPYLLHIHCPLPHLPIFYN